MTVVGRTAMLLYTDMTRVCGNGHIQTLPASSGTAVILSADMTGIRRDWNATVYAHDWGLAGWEDYCKHTSMVTGGMLKLLYTHMTGI